MIKKSGTQVSEAHHKTMNDESVPTLMYPNVQIFIFLPTFMHVIHLLNSIRKYVLPIYFFEKLCLQLTIDKLV